MSNELLITVGGLALLDTLSPATLGVTVYLLLTERERLSSRLMIYLASVAAFYFSVGVALMLGLDALLPAMSSLLENRTISWGLFILGAILFIASFYYPKSKKSSNMPRPRSKSMAAMIALGFTTSLIEVGTALPYFAAIGLMTAHQLPLFQWLPLLAGYNFIMVLPPIIVFVLHSLLGRVMERPLEKLQAYFTKHSGSAVSWIMCIVGIILIFNTLDYL